MPWSHHGHCTAQQLTSITAGPGRSPGDARPPRGPSRCARRQPHLDGGECSPPKSRRRARRQASPAATLPARPSLRCRHGLRGPALPPAPPLLCRERLCRPPLPRNSTKRPSARSPWGLWRLPSLWKPWIASKFTRGTRPTASTRLLDALRAPTAPTGRAPAGVSSTPNDCSRGFAPRTPLLTVVAKSDLNDGLVMA